MIGRIRCWYLHTQYGGGGTAENKYKAASKMLRIALRSSANQLELLNWALNVILSGGRFHELKPATDFHRQYWELGVVSAKRREKEKMWPELGDRS